MTTDKTIALYEQRIIEFNKSSAKYGKKWVVVCGNMPINFDSITNNLWCKLEDATFWSSREFAEANAPRVEFPNGEVGKVVLVDDHLAWAIVDLEEWIAELKGE